MAKSQIGSAFGLVTTITTRLTTGIKGNEEAVLGLSEDTKNRLVDELVAKLITEATIVPPVPEPLWRKINDTTISVNLDFSPKLPFDGARVERHEGHGWFGVEKRADGLYVGGRKVELYLSQRQLNGKTIKGYELRDEVTKKVVLNANILDALYENQHLIPEDWKRDDKGNVRYIFFWGTIYRNPETDSLYVRCLYFNDGAWHRFYYWLDIDWDDNSPAALLAS